MKRAVFAIIPALFLCFSAGHSQAAPAGNVAVNIPPQETKTVDVNKDGIPDVTYYRDGEYVSKVEADTNYDGSPDVVVYTKDGKFLSAEADVDYDGKADKKFKDVNEFNQWVNENNPDFQEQLNRPDWKFDLMKF